MEGPRFARPEELPAIIELAEHVFCDLENLPRSMARRFPLFLSQANLEHMVVAMADGRAASFMGSDLRTFVTRGCRIPCGLLGAVCTHEDFRGRGLAGRSLELTYRRLKDRGAAMVWISGGRRLYWASGGATCWPLYVGSAQRGRLAAVADPSLEVEPLGEPNLPEMVSLHDAEPVRFEWRPPWLPLVPLALQQSGTVVSWLIRREGRAVAAACLREPDRRKDSAELLDWFGDRRAMTAALARIAGELGVGNVSSRYTSYDGRLAALMADAGFEARRMKPAYWTLKVLDFARLLDCLRPHLERSLADETGAFEAAGQGIRITAGGQIYTASDEPTAVRILFALPDEYEEAAAAMPPAVRRLVARALPVPLRHYGLNYI